MKPALLRAIQADAAINHTTPSSIIRTILVNYYDPSVRRVMLRHIGVEYKDE
jgi:hypothetical protein